MSLHDASPVTEKSGGDVIIVGAGPVDLLLYAMLTIPFNRLECVPHRIWAAYELGVQRDGVFSADNPVQSNPSPTHAD
jgi:hypothetical protein